MSIEVGGVMEGKVTGITKFGAFVDLADGKVGLVHISEVADVYVNDINDFLKVGQTVKVKVPPLPTTVFFTVISTELRVLVYVRVTAVWSLM